MSHASSCALDKWMELHCKCVLLWNLSQTFVSLLITLRWAGLGWGCGGLGGGGGGGYISGLVLSSVYQGSFPPSLAVSNWQLCATSSLQTGLLIFLSSSLCRDGQSGISLGADLS